MGKLVDEVAASTHNLKMAGWAVHCGSLQASSCIQLQACGCMASAPTPTPATTPPHRSCHTLARMDTRTHQAEGRCWRPPPLPASPAEALVVPGHVGAVQEDVGLKAAGEGAAVGLHTTEDNLKT